MIVLCPYSDLIGVPYLAGGRTVAGLDCWGLVMECGRRMDLRIPDYFAGETDQTVSDGQAGGTDLSAWVNRETWMEIPLTIPDAMGAVLAFRNGHGYIDHAGVLLDEEFFLHAIKDVGVVKGRYKREPWRSRFSGVYVYHG
jgi:cell wall-associated NlpC family hydrolase